MSFVGYDVLIPVRRLSASSLHLSTSEQNSRQKGIGLDSRASYSTPQCTGITNAVRTRYYIPSIHQDITWYLVSNK